MNDRKPAYPWSQQILVVLLIAILVAGLVALGTEGLVGIGHLVQTAAAPDNSVR